MADETESELSRVARVVKRSIGLGARDVDLPVEGAAKERKEKADAEQGEALRRLRGLASGKNPITGK